MPSSTAHSHERIRFVQQSSWLMIANLTGGVLMWAVHFLAKKVPEEGYGVYVAVLALIGLLPVVPVQMVVVQQTALAIARGTVGSLASMARRTWAVASLLWLVVAIGVTMFRARIVATFQLEDGRVLIPALAMLLLAFWGPIFAGLLHGSQRFWWLGWTIVLSSAGRLGGAALLVLLVAASGVNMTTGVLIGLGLGVAFAMWHTRDLWTASGAPFDGRALVRHAWPLLVGFGAWQFLMMADTLFVKRAFSPEQTAFYGAAGTLCRAMVWGVSPLAVIMFPKVVESVSHQQRHSLLQVTLVGTGLLAGVGGASLALLGPWVIRLVFRDSYVDTAAALLPWYASAMVPLVLANVLVNHLLARSDTRIVPWLLGLALGYGVCLGFVSDSLVRVVQLLGGFSLCVLAAGLLLQWRTRDGAGESGVGQPLQENAQPRP